MISFVQIMRFKFLSDTEHFAIVWFLPIFNYIIYFFGHTGLLEEKDGPLQGYYSLNKISFYQQHPFGSNDCFYKISASRIVEFELRS